jgi:hypothetical protein
MVELIKIAEGLFARGIAASVYGKRDPASDHIRQGSCRVVSSLSRAGEGARKNRA